MKDENIQVSVNRQYEIIKKANEKLELLRSKCKHNHSIEVTYSFRVGDLHQAMVCRYCGQYLERVGPFDSYKIFGT